MAQHVHLRIDTGLPIYFSTRTARGNAARTRTPTVCCASTSPKAPHATNITFGALHTGDGTAWFDALTVELDGALYTNPSRFDSDFESSTPVGFSTGDKAIK